MSELITRNPDGSTEGRDPRKLPRDVLAAAHQPAPLLSVIRAKCLECSCCQPSEVAKCTATGCPLWPYRMGKNPFSNRKGNRAALAALWNANRRPKSPIQQDGISADEPTCNTPPDD